MFSEERLRGHRSKEEWKVRRKVGRGKSGRDVLYVRRLYFQ